MDLDNIECVSSSDGMEEEEIHHLHHHHHNLNHNHVVHQFSSKPLQNGVVPPAAAPATSVHELLECPVCTNSMYPPIHQVSVYMCAFLLLFRWFLGLVIVCLMVGKYGKKGNFGVLGIVWETRKLKSPINREFDTFVILRLVDENCGRRNKKYWNLGY